MPIFLEQKWLSWSLGHFSRIFLQSNILKIYWNLSKFIDISVSANNSWTEMAFLNAGSFFEIFSPIKYIKNVLKFIEIYRNQRQCQSFLNRNGFPERWVLFSRFFLQSNILKIYWNLSKFIEISVSANNSWTEMAFLNAGSFFEIFSPNKYIKNLLKFIEISVSANLSWTETAFLNALYFFEIFFLQSNILKFQIHW